MTSRSFVVFCAFAVLGICIYVFLLGNNVFEGDFRNDGIAWYFLAKGIFCSLTLVLVERVLEAVRQVRRAQQSMETGGAD